MENSNRQAIGDRVVSVWKKFQSRRSSARDSGEVDLPASSPELDSDEPLADRSGYSSANAASQNPAVAAMSKIFDKDLFSEAVAPISKLNLPTVTLNPWSAFWAVLAAMVGGTGITSYLLLIAVPPTPTCQGILPVSTDSERLYCAQVGADTQEIPKLRAAVNLVKDWTDRHPLYRESQRLLKEWSEDLTRAGRKQLNAGQIDKAIATLKIIPPTSPIYDRTQETLAKWSVQSKDSASIEAKFEGAMKTGDWNQAFVILQSVQRMRGSYWSGFKYDKMSAKLAIERDAWDKLQEAKDALVEKDSDDYNTRAKRMELAVKAAKKGKEVELPLPQQPEPIVKAMKLANLIDPQSYAYLEGQTLRSKWSRHLVNLSVDLYKQQNFNDAIAIVQKVPQDVSIYAEAQDWVKLNQAHVWAGKRHLLATIDAIDRVKKIPKTSPIYTLARTKQSNWQSMLKQQTQLQWARTIANFQQPATLAMAIETAKQVPAQSEVGQTIQSEVVTWNRQIETIDNRIILAKARQIVNKGDSLGNLKAAVKLAGKITKDRPLGEEITTAVAEWTEKIQTIEDRPILNNAIATAQGGNFAGAIEIANQIAPGRSLYREAQAEVRYWSLELQEIADRRTLERAINIYRQGKISTAIDLAATIGRRSPIYGDARSYVANWRLLLTPRSVSN
ncbi:hypothetical protein [Chamaesiphon minutus]|uniref:Chromosome segregation ATPase n=1 Tax=Chamaesiphon minutus (strain ATCC 27169 / PCC 6605) TaxID=1173020 RepID=K9UPJ8_CHAP6|nr:hypothetical protein [Chamaesiphon minutus]AFY96613.1 hypothetical protein Cha6605_5757 [Chamaesiphon minutus PCC 6605]